MRDCSENLAESPGSPFSLYIPQRTALRKVVFPDPVLRADDRHRMIRVGGRLNNDPVEASEVLNLDPSHSQHGYSPSRRTAIAAS